MRRCIIYSTLFHSLFGNLHALADSFRSYPHHNIFLPELYLPIFSTTLRHIEPLIMNIAKHWSATGYLGNFPTFWRQTFYKPRPKYDKVTRNHITPTLTKADFAPGKMMPDSHSAESICAALKEHLSRVPSEWTDTQWKALRKLKKEGLWSRSEPNATNLQSMGRCFEIFDGLFFNGLLSEYCILFFPVTERRWGYSQRYGYCELWYPDLREQWKFRSWLPPLMCDIVINFFTSTTSSERRAADLQDTLIHEMLHALFSLYTCKRDNGCCWAAMEGEVWAGHSPLWMEAGQAIEDCRLGKEQYWDDTVKRSFAIAPNLAREESMAAQVHLTGANLPPAHELARLGLDIVEIWSHIEAFRAQGKIAREDELNSVSVCFGAKKVFHWDEVLGLLVGGLAYAAGYGWGKVSRV